MEGTKSARVGFAQHAEQTPGSATQVAPGIEAEEVGTSRAAGAVQDNGRIREVRRVLDPGVQRDGCAGTVVPLQHPGRQLGTMDLFPGWAARCDPVSEHGLQLFPRDGPGSQKAGAAWIAKVDDR